MHLNGVFLSERACVCVCVHACMGGYVCVNTLLHRCACHVFV